MTPEPGVADPPGSNLARRARWWRNDCERLASAAQALAEHGPEMILRSAVPLKSGYPSGSGVAVSGGDVTDRTGDAGAANADPEDWADTRVAEAVEEMERAMHAALRLVRTAERARARAERLLDPKDPPSSDPARCCNCERHDVWAPVYKRGRCYPCWEHLDAHDLDAPQWMVLERPEYSGLAARRRARPAEPDLLRRSR